MFTYKGGKIGNKKNWNQRRNGIVRNSKLKEYNLIKWKEWGKMIDYITVTYKIKGNITEEKKQEIIKDMHKQGFSIEKITKTYIRFIKFN